MSLVLLCCYNLRPMQTIVLRSAQHSIGMPGRSNFVEWSYQRIPWNTWHLSENAFANRFRHNNQSVEKTWNLVPKSVLVHRLLCSIWSKILSGSRDFFLAPYVRSKSLNAHSGRQFTSFFPCTWEDSYLLAQTDVAYLCRLTQSSVPNVHFFSTSFATRPNPRQTTPQRRKA
jgi:hypothetical protein